MRLAAVAHFYLAAAVVSAVTGLYKERSEIIRRPRQLIGASNLAMRANGKSTVGQPTLLRGSILHHREDSGARPHRRVPRRRRERVDADLLDLERDNVAVTR